MLAMAEIYSDSAFDRAAKVHTNDQAPQTHRGVVLVEGDAQEAAALPVLDWTLEPHGHGIARTEAKPASVPKSRLKLCKEEVNWW